MFFIKIKIVNLYKHKQMKNYKFLTAIFLAVSGSLFSQMNPVEIIKVKKDNQYSISLKNNTAQDLDLSLYVTGSGFEQINLPITKRVSKFETVEFTTIKPEPNTTKINFSTSYQVRGKSKEKELAKK